MLIKLNRRVNEQVDHRYREQNDSLWAKREDNLGLNITGNKMKFKFHMSKEITNSWFVSSSN